MRRIKRARRRRAGAKFCAVALRGAGATQTVLHFERVVRTLGRRAAAHFWLVAHLQARVRNVLLAALTSRLGRHMVLSGAKLSAGHDLPLPSHTSARSHAPAAYRHTTPWLATRSVGQFVLAPSQLSGTSCKHASFKPRGAPTQIVRIRL